MRLSFVTQSPEETIKLGENLGKIISPPLIVALYGELGSGKTTFLKGVARGLGVEKIRSPSFIMITRYKGKYPIIHVDLYRLDSGEELVPLGLKDMLYDETSVVFIEWAERAESLLPSSRISVKISHLNGETSREIIIEASGDREKKILKFLLDSLERRRNSEIM